MERASGASLGLHFDYFGNSAPNVLPAFLLPLIGPFAHRRRRSDGIDRDDFVEAVGDVRDRFISIQDNHGSSHFGFPPRSVDLGQSLQRSLLRGSLRLPKPSPQAADRVHRGHGSLGPSDRTPRLSPPPLG